MKVDLGIWEKLPRVIIGLLITATLVAITLRYLPGIRANEMQRRQILLLQAEHDLLVAQAETLRSEIDVFLSPRAVERLARVLLNRARTNEIVIRIEPPQANTSLTSYP